MLRRQELCGELQSRSLRISRLLQILQQHAADAKNVKQSYIKVVNQKKKQLKERADALESKKMENEELTLENRLLRERFTKLEGMADERESKLSFADFTVTKFDRMYAAVCSENAALRKLIERRGLGSPLRMPTPPPPPPPRPPSVGRMPSKQKKAWEDLPPPASPDQLSPRGASPTISFLERSYAEMRALRTPSPQHIDPFPTRAVQMRADAGLAQEEEELNEWIVHEATQIGADAGLVQEEINELIGHAQEMADDVLMEQPGSTTNMDAQRNIAAAQMLNIIMAVGSEGEGADAIEPAAKRKGSGATAIEPAVDQQQQQQHQQQLARARRTSPAVAPPAPKGADATATEPAVEQQQQQQQQHQQQLVRARRTSPAVAPPAPTKQKGAAATATEPAVEQQQQQQQQHQQQLVRARRTSPAVAPPAPTKQKGADATATEPAVEQQQQQQQQHQQQLVRARRTSPAVAPPAPTKQKGAAATATEPAVEQQQQQQQQHQQQLVRARRTSPAVAPVAVTPAPAKQKGEDATATGKKRRGADILFYLQLPPPSPTKNRADLDRFALASLRRTQPNRRVKYQPVKKIDIKWRTREPPVPLGPPAPKRSVSVTPRVWVNVAPMATLLAAPPHPVERSASAAPTGRPAGADARPNHSICATCGHVLGLTRTKETTKIKGFEKDSVADAVVCNGCNAAFHRDAKLTCCPSYHSAGPEKKEIWICDKTGSMLLMLLRLSTLGRAARGVTERVVSSPIL
ncbi:hypothetical protein niasHS_017208 [Heterodera schachtii]|uniref:Uncharacterized protein n=1 Tax=Heterodera schachtii TaxID=97005 RepID=A0ABD2I1U6_HETSC